MSKKARTLMKIEKYLINLINEGRKETLEEMSINMNVNINSFATYVSRQKELKDIYKKCKLRKTTTKKRKPRTVEKIEKYLTNLINEDRKETLEDMAKNMGINVYSFQVYVSRYEELKSIYRECKIRKNVTKNGKSQKVEKIEKHLLNLIEEEKKETLKEISKNTGINIDTLRTYVSRYKDLKKLYKQCKPKNVTKNVSSIIDKWESGMFDKIQVSNITLTEEEELKNDIISFLEKNDNITKDDILNKFNITIGRLNSLKSRDYDFKKKFNKLSKTKTYVIEEKIKNILDNSTEKKTIKELQVEMDGVGTLYIYNFLKNNEQYNEKIFRKGKRKNEKTKTYVIEEKIKNILDNSTEKKTIKELQVEMDGVGTLYIYNFLKNNEQYNEKIFRKGKRKNEKKD